MQNTLKLGLMLLVSTTLTSTSILAQEASSPSRQELQNLQELAEQVKAALQQGDLERANRLSSDLMTGIFKLREKIEPTPQEKLLKLEQAAPLSGKERFHALSNLAKVAFEAGELGKAESYARELLAAAADYQKDWNYGNAIFHGNMVIGRVALRRDNNMIQAKSSLLASAQTPGSPQLNSFGPNMSLAKDLLAQGERDTVLEFFVSCRKFWKLRPEKLDAWTATVKGGAIPDFGANLLY
jgi:hypothetical protein